MTIRAERSLGQVCSEEQYARVFKRMNTLPSGVEHLIVQLGDATDLVAFSSSETNVNIGIPIAYPRLTFLESALSTRLNPLGLKNHFNGDAELLDDLVLISSSPRLLSELISF